MKQFAAYFTRGVRNGARLRKAIYRVRSQEEACAAVSEFFEGQLGAAA